MTHTRGFFLDPQGNLQPFKDFRSALLTCGVDEDVAEEWLEIRKKKKARNSEYSFKVLVREAQKANISIAQAVEYSADHQWQGFFAEWYTKTKRNDTSRADNEFASRQQQYASLLQMELSRGQ